jgi:hypothetical protein
MPPTTRPSRPPFPPRREPASAGPAADTRSTIVMTSHRRTEPPRRVAMIECMSASRHPWGAVRVPRRGRESPHPRSLGLASSPRDRAAGDSGDRRPQRGDAIAGRPAAIEGRGGSSPREVGATAAPSTAIAIAAGAGRVASTGVGHRRAAVLPAATASPPAPSACAAPIAVSRSSPAPGVIPTSNTRLTRTRSTCSILGSHAGRCQRRSQAADRARAPWPRPTSLRLAGFRGGGPFTAQGAPQAIHSASCWRSAIVGAGSSVGIPVFVAFGPLPAI